ncbi:uncharacterized protein LOC135446904 [Zonotrichia leucophrys gambelii]|uniref:uncharacterized protein LOC135446904 n=1 Tax=Zonotrichia leucophrys gambelii TaxID=257770 RepID=UPI00313FF2AA
MGHSAGNTKLGSQDTRFWVVPALLSPRAPAGLRSPCSSSVTETLGWGPAAVSSPGAASSQCPGPQVQVTPRTSCPGHRAPSQRALKVTACLSAPQQPKQPWGTCPPVLPAAQGTQPGHPQASAQKALAGQWVEQSSQPLFGLSFGEELQLPSSAGTQEFLLNRCPSELGHNAGLCHTGIEREVVNSWGLWWDSWESQLVPRLHWNEWTRFSSALGPPGGNPSRSSLRGNGWRVAPGAWSLSHPRARGDPGRGAGTPVERGVTPPSAGDTGQVAPGLSPPRQRLCDPGTAPRIVQGLRFPRTQEQEVFYSRNRARTVELMHERQQTQCRSEIPGGR